MLSLWKVDDTATALLMTRFYENLLGVFKESRELPNRSYGSGEAMPKAEALREAKVWLRNLPRSEAERACQTIGLDELHVPRGGPALPPGEKVTATASGPAVDRPYSHPFYWAAFILIGDRE